MALQNPPFFENPMCLTCNNNATTEFTADIQFVHNTINISIMCLTYTEGKNLVECGETHISLSYIHNNIPKGYQPIH
jgi:hypothetical protein